MPGPVTFLASGVSRTGATRGALEGVSPAIGRLKDSVLLTAERGGGGRQDVQRVTAVPGKEVVVIHVAGGPALWLHPEHARELLQSQEDVDAQRGAADRAPADGEVRVPPRLRWRLEHGVPTSARARGFLGDVLVRALDIVTDMAEDKAADFVASKVVKHFDGRVNPGVYRLNPEQLTPLADQSTVQVARSSDPSLVLLHGTFSETSSTFGKLWVSHPQLVRTLFSAYGDRVYALDHPTLGSSPIANAITLAEALPDRARLHLLSHSRGGLVAEVLARVAAGKPDVVSGFSRTDHAKDHRELQRLAALVSKKKIQVERLVRVACPARGTLLASKRLDAYVSVVTWALELAGVPVAPQLLSFLGEVARRRADPDSLPGLAAQMPDSPLVQWLHSGEAIAGDLRVVAGDITGDSVVSWIKTLLSDAFYWTDNDLIVQTRSMYGGSPRRTASTFALDQGGKVSHFNYFSNSASAEAIVNALVNDAPSGFRVIGPLSWEGTSSAGVRAARGPRRSAPSTLPALFVLPGILGSHLKVGDERVWLDRRLVNGFGKLAYGTGKKDTVTPDGPIGMFYDDLMAYLSADHEVIPFGFDWRRPIEDEAERLADAVETALRARKESGAPVRMVAHSLGGLVARTMHIVRRDVWTRMMKMDGARVLMLGTPNAGSWAPMQVLSGDDTFGNMLTIVGAPFRGHETRQLIAQFPGLLQLQAGLLNGLGSEKTWKDLAAADLAAVKRQSGWHTLPIQQQQFAWGIPPQRVLDRAVRLRKALDLQRDRDLPQFSGKLLLVVGNAPLTPSGFEVTDNGVVYFDVPSGGDGRVTLESAMLPGVDTWMLDRDHGSLPRRREAFDAYRQLLNEGTTDRLPRLAASAVRGETAAAEGPLVRSRPARSLVNGAPPQHEAEILAVSDSAPGTTRASNPGTALRITVVNADMTYVSMPMILGHYRSMELTGSEAIMDRALGGAMSESLHRDLYPSAVGDHQVFVNSHQPAENPWRLPRPAAVIVAGLGPEGELRGTDLVRTVKQAVVAWAQRLTERSPMPALFSLASTLIGSGGLGITAAQSAQFVAQGVLEANAVLRGEDTDPRRWPQVEELHFIECYLDRAADAWRALQGLASAFPARYTVAPVIQEGIGSMRRNPDPGYRGVEYDFISALIQKDDKQDERIVYTIDTKRARSEVRAQSAQVRLIKDLVSGASSNTNNDPEIGRTLFRLLVPVDLEAFMASSSATVLELDTGTAGIPWELLDNQLPTSGDIRPWAIRTKLLRKLRTTVPGGSVKDASTDDSVLVIGDPACDRKRYPVLYGARREAALVASTLGALQRAPAAGRGRNKSLPRVLPLVSQDDPSSEPDARAVTNAIMAGPWRIIHIAGHGEPPLADGTRSDPRGVVLTGESFLGPTEIGALRVTPELVFVNCCHLARAAGGQLLQETNYDRARFASGVAEALIKLGVRCVVAAGWAVDDDAAEAFARMFYTRLLRGDTFIEAVAAAREEARTLGGNTWAAYQCYGDPNWRYRRETQQAQLPTTPEPADEFSGISSAVGLVLSLDMLAVKSEFQGATSASQHERLRYLEKTFESFWRNSGAVAEAFGNAWAKSGGLEEAVSWYERSRTAEDARSSLAAIEQLANLKVRRAWSRVAQAGPRDRKAVAEARREIASAIALLDTLLAVGPTIERESIYGSAFKRLAMLDAREGRDEDELRAIGKMREHYEAAERIARQRLVDAPSEDVNVFYPAMNRIAAELALRGGTRESRALDDETLDVVRRSMSAVTPDFWSVVGQTELDVYTSVSGGSLEANLTTITDSFREHFTRVSAPKMWGSVYDNATFVLTKYMSRAKEREAKAARMLLDALAKFAGQTPV